jgi:cell division protein FtsL
MRTRKTKSKVTFKDKMKSIFLSAQGLPIVLSLVVITILFVLFRMKGVEMNYQISSLNKDIEKVKVEGKELKAKKAKLLSVKNLRKMAKAHDLQQPRQKQIIVIP